MTVESLNHMMTYVIEGWTLLSATYLSVGFTVSLTNRVRNGLKEKEVAKAKMAASVTEETSNAERVAEMTAVAEKYTKSAGKQQVKSGVKVPER